MFIQSEKQLFSKDCNYDIRHAALLLLISAAAIIFPPADHFQDLSEKQPRIHAMHHQIRLIAFNEYSPNQGTP